MLVPHLHLNGRCGEALTFYAKAFDTQADCMYLVSENDPTQGVEHSEMHIHGQRVMLNDNGGNKNGITDAAVQIVLIFENTEALKIAYERMLEGSIILTPMHTPDYSPCVVHFMDRFGVCWVFMV